MSVVEQQAGWDAIATHLAGILREVIEWDVGEITPDTHLGGLGLESISLVYLIAEVQQHYGLRDRLFQRLREQEVLITDLRLRDVVEIVHALRSGDGEEAS
jgi:acyl carrier protein